MKRLKVKRLIYRAQIKQDCEDEAIARIREAPAPKQKVADGGLMVFGAWSWKMNVFLYYECIDDSTAPQNLHPDSLLPETAGLLEDWPGEDEKRKWIPMIDVFHFNEPESPEHWSRKTVVEKRMGRVAHLKPEMTASYIYYHFQLQEERAFSGPKYEIIAMHENLLFGYQEFPAIVEEPPAPKKLHTADTPVNWDDSRMDLHFDPWPDGHLYFKHIEEIVTHYR